LKRRGKAFWRCQNDFLSLKTHVQQALSQSAGLDDYSRKVAAMEKHLTEVDGLFDRITGKESMVLAISSKIDLLLESLNKQDGGQLLTRTVSELSQIEDRQKKNTDLMAQLEKQARSFSTEIAAIQTNFGQTRATAESVAGQVSVMEKEMETFRLLKDKIDNLNNLSEYVKTKIKYLGDQKVVVDKANEEAGRLNTLTWRIDSEMKLLQDRLAKLEKTEKAVSKINAMLEESRTSLNEIRHFEKFMEQTTQKMSEIRALDTSSTRSFPSSPRTTRTSTR